LNLGEHLSLSLSLNLMVRACAQLFFFLVFLKEFEKIVYRRMQWAVEARFLIPDFQSRFRNFRSCTDNLVTLTNQIYSAFLNNASIVAIFLDIADAFDNVIPNIFIQKLRNAGFPACLCKFIENLLAERLIYTVRNGELSSSLITHKGIPQGSILSPLLFNFYLKNIGQYLDKNSQILQYGSNIVIFSSNEKPLLAWSYFFLFKCYQWLPPLLGLGSGPT